MPPGYLIRCPHFSPLHSQERGVRQHKDLQSQVFDLVGSEKVWVRAEEEGYIHLVPHLFTYDVPYKGRKVDQGAPK